MGSARYPGFNQFDLRDRWREIAAGRLNVAASSLLFDFFPVGQTGEGPATYFVGTGTGTRSYQATALYRLDTGGATGAAKWQPGGIAGNFPVPAVAGAGTKVWVGFRGKFLDGAGANSFCLGGLFDGSGTVAWGIGARGSQSTTAFVVYGSTGTPFSIGMNFDTNLHDWELYRADGATTVPVVDGVQKTTGDARANANAGLGVQGTDSAGAQRRIDLVWVAIATVAP